MRLVLAAAPLMHAHRAVHGARRADRRRRHRHAAVAPAGRVSSSGTRSSGSASPASRSSAWPSRSRCCEALDANPGRWDLRRLRVIGSSGTVWSMENKQGLLAPRCRTCAMFDSLGSSEAVGVGGSTSSAGADGGDGQVHGRPEQRRLHRGRPPGRAGVGRARPARASPASCRSATTRTRRRRRRTFRSLRGPALVGAGRFRHRGGGRHAASCWAAARR